MEALRQVLLSTPLLRGPCSPDFSRVLWVCDKSFTCEPLYTLFPEAWAVFLPKEMCDQEIQAHFNMSLPQSVIREVNPLFIRNSYVTCTAEQKRF